MVPIHIPADRFLFLGLKLMGFRVVEPIARTKKNLDRFLGCFGTTPEAASAIFRDLQTTNIEKAVVHGINFKYYMMTLNWLKSYKVAHELAALFQIREDAVCKWTWFYTKKIQALKEAKIRSDVLDGASVTIEGVDFRIAEPRNHALMYEIGITIHHNQIMLLNGPTAAATHGIMTMFTQAHHESFNGRIRVFNILATRFRHSVQEHEAVFEAACVIVQYDMETGCPL